MARRILVGTFRVLMKWFTRTEVSGLENVPPHGACLLVSNHLGWMDVPLAAVNIPRDDFTGWIANKHLRNPFMLMVVKVMQAIWINREEADFHALRTALQYLKEGRMLAVAPEGTRSKVTHALLPGKQGAAYLAMKAGVPILPVALTGPETANAQLKRFRRPRLSLTVGKPFELPELNGAGREEILQAGTEEIMCQIAALLPPAYRGVYADHPRLLVLLSERAI